MQPNPVLKNLGFAPDERVVIIHTDDIGMCQASVSAFADLWDYGLISSGATMVPCPWFPEAAEYCRNHPGVDMGVHLTLTSEWENYRWGPISTRDKASGLVDDQGFFYRSTEDAQEHGDPAAAALELRSQIERPLAFGMQPTHADTHMGTVAHPKFIPSYIQLAIEYGLPPMIMRLDEAGWLEYGMATDVAQLAAGMVAQLEEQGVPLIDNLATLELDQACVADERIAYAKRVFNEMKPGITHFIIHPSQDTPELRAIAPDWACRVADYQAFLSDDLRDYIRSSGVQIIGYQALRELMPSA